MEEAIVSIIKYIMSKGYMAMISNLYFAATKVFFLIPKIYLKIITDMILRNKF